MFEFAITSISYFTTLCYFNILHYYSLSIITYMNDLLLYCTFHSLNVIHIQPGTSLGILGPLTEFSYGAPPPPPN